MYMETSFLTVHMPINTLNFEISAALEISVELFSSTVTKQQLKKKTEIQYSSLCVFYDWPTKHLSHIIKQFES